MLRDSPHLEEVWNLDDHHQADAAPGAALDEREHPLAKAHRVAGGRHEVGKAVDDDPLGVRRLDQVEQLVDPLVDVHVDEAAAHDVHALVLERPAKAAHDPAELGLVFLERGQDARLARAGAGVDEMQP